jgi:MobA/MobL family protein
MSAEFFVQIRALSRGKGARAPHAAAYRAGERIRDRRMSDTYDYSDRNDVLYKEIVLPKEWDGCGEVDWARDRETLWNTAELPGRCNARVAREVLVFLPLELTPGQRIELVRRFSRELAEKYRGAVDVAIHAPRLDADERHNHAHLLMTTREITPKGLGRRTTLEIMGADRRARGLEGHAREEFLWVRRGWAHAVNEAYREAGLALRVDPRSYKERGIDYEPPPSIPQKVLYAERNTGRATPAGNQIRAMYRERVEARLKGGDELARVLQKQQEQERQRKMEYAQRMAAVPRKKARSAMTREERNALRRAARAEKKRLRAPEKRVLEQQAPPVKTPAPRESVVAWLEFRKRLAPQASTDDPVAKWKEFRARQGQEGAADDSIAKWRDFRALQPRQASAEDSIAKWKSLRERQGPEETPQDSIARWRKVRERELQAREARGEANERARGQGSAGKTDDDDEEEQRRKRNRSRDCDFEL